MSFIQDILASRQDWVAHPRCCRVRGPDEAAIGTTTSVRKKIRRPMKMKRLTKLGIALSAGWLLIIGAIIARDVTGALAMKLNEAGDFLAGVTAPLALLWLVVGYFQHGEELKLNTKALHAQQEELRRQVEETATLAKNAERQAKAAEHLALLSKEEQEREEMRRIADAQPEFVEAGARGSGRRMEIGILNRGGEIRDIELRYEGPYQLGFSPTRRWGPGAKATLTLVQRDRPLEYPIAFALGYTDGLDVRHEKEFELQHDYELREITTKERREPKG